MLPTVSGSAATGNASINLTQTLSAPNLAPALSLTLAVDKANATPSDTLTYSSTVTNSGSTLSFKGSYMAANNGNVTATVSAYYDDLEYYSVSSKSWVGLAGFAASQSGYQFVAPPPIRTGMNLTALSVPASGVIYPSAGDPIVGTAVSVGATAAWNFTATVPLTPGQISLLADRTRVNGLRNVIHFEVTPRATSQGQPFVYRSDLVNLLQSGSAAANVTITINTPSGSPLQFNSSTTPALASVGSGQSVTVSGHYQIPAALPKAATESDSAYFSRLQGIEGSALTASATATGSSGGPSATVTSNPTSVSTTEHVPIVSITKGGPQTLTAGSNGTYSFALQNSGGADASNISITDSVPSGTTSGDVTGIPATLAAGTSSTTPQATFQVLASQSGGPLQDTASLFWQDKNGNSYGPVSSSYTTQVVAANRLVLSAAPGPNPTGATVPVTATVLDPSGNTVGGQSVTLDVTGPNQQRSYAITDPLTGVGTFNYTGTIAGVDTLQASLTNGVQSNTVTVTWFTPIQKVSSTAVQGNFYAEPANPQSFVVTAQSTPDFAQTFPTIDFDPPSGFIPHSPPGIPTDQTRPFTDVTTDVNGNYNGTIVAQGNGLQAGLGSLTNFDAVFTANFIVAQAGDVTFNFYADDGFLFGVRNGATRVSGANENPPASNKSAILGYPLMGAFNQPGAGTRPVTVHFPGAGTYPYELDYFEANGGGLSLSMGVATFNPQTNPLSIYVGYADGLRAAGSIFPFPWMGSQNVNFIGCCPPFDAGAIRFDNSSAAPIVLDSVTVDIGSYHFDLWGRNLEVPANGILMLSQTSQYNFDTSDYSGVGCGGNNGVIPKVNVTIAGVSTTYNDTKQILNTFGYDLACQGNESQSWQRIGGGGSTINVPLPPATTLALTPATVSGNLVGQTQTFTVAAMDATGAPVPNLPVTLTIAGANGSGVLNGTTQVKGTTDGGGLARLSYVGTNAGTDTAQVSAFVLGLQALSNSVSVPWSLAAIPGGGSAPAPAITSPSPADGTVVTKPVAISANFAPPAGQTITSWSVTYQDQDPSAPVTLASGSGTPPSPLAILDPTLLPDDTYLLTISATASGGGTQILTSSVVVAGNLKLGRYVTSYQDLSVTVGGLQMEVRRKYDSIDKHPGDFGIGWHVELANFRVTSNRQLGAGGWTQYNTYCFIGLCLTGFKTSIPHYVIVTFPDGHQESFDFTPTGGTNIFLEGTAAFSARPGTTSTLEAVGDPSLSYYFDGNLYGSNGQPYNPTRFKLVTRDGRAFILDTALGLISEMDANGNSLNVDSGGVHAKLGPASSPTPGPSITFTRDSQGRITDIDGPASGQHYHYGYFPTLNELQSVTDPMGNSVSFSYDPQSGNLQQTRDPNSQPAQTLTYDASGRLVSIANGSEPPTTISTSVGAQQQVLLDPNGKLSTVLTYDDRGDVIERDQSFSGKTLKTTFSFDSEGKPLSVSDPLQNTTTLGYEAGTGNLLTVSSAGRTWSLENYNAMGEPGLIRRPDGTIQLSMTYDPKTGSILTRQAPGQNATRFSYYSNGLPQTVIDPGGRSITYSYDSNGQLSAIADSQGRSARLSIDVAGNVHSVTDQLGNETDYQHNADGTLSSISDANHHQWQFQYDALGRLQQMTDPLGHAMSYLYNDVGELQQQTDRNGSVTAYQYDVDGLLTKETRPGNDVVNYGYDPLGRLTETDNASSHIDRTYDDDSRLSTETTCANTGASSTACSPIGNGSQPTVTLSYTYFPDSQLKSVASTDPAISPMQYGYDALGRLASIQYGNQAPFTFGYDSLGRPASLARPNGVADAFGYDASGDLTSRDESLAGATISRFDYSLDPTTGQRTSMTDNTGTTNYTYYANGWLQSATHPAASGIPNESYSYDAVGNRSSGGSQSSFDAADRLQSDGSFNYVFDAEGNLTSKSPKAGGPATSFTWNTDHQLLGISYPDGTTSSYRYDSFGRRIAAVDKGEEARFVYDGLSAKADYNSQNQLQTSYVPGLEALTSSGQPSYYLKDGLGSVRALTDASGALTGTYAYDSFGKPAASNPSPSRETFTGYQYDSTSGLYNAGARYYDSSVGRFLSEDPIGSIDPYPHAANDPVNQVDAYGMQATAEYGLLLSDEANNAQCVAGFVGAIAGVGLSAAAAALGGYAINADDVMAAMAIALVVNSAACVINAATSKACNGALHLKYKPGWTAAQRAEADAKVAALNDAAARGELSVVEAGPRGASASSIWDSQVGTPRPPGYDVDHIIDRQLGGSDSVENLWLLNSSVNRSLGPQIAHQIAGLPIGALIGSVSIC